MISEKEMRGRKIHAFFAVIFLCAVCVFMYFSIKADMNQRAEDAIKMAQYHLSWGEPLRDRLLPKFDSLDTNQDNVLDAAEIVAAQSIATDEDTKNALIYAGGYIGRVGHVIDTKTSMQYWRMPNGGQTLRTVYHYVYGISKSDLTTYPDRVKAESKDLLKL